MTELTTQDQSINQTLDKGGLSRAVATFQLIQLVIQLPSLLFREQPTKLTEGILVLIN